MKRRHISLCMAIALTITSVFPGGIVTAEETPASATEAVSEAIDTETSDIAEAAPQDAQVGQDEAALPEEQAVEAQSQDSEADAILEEAEDTEEAANPADGSVVNAETGQIAVEGVEVVSTPAMTVEEAASEIKYEINGIDDGSVDTSKSLFLPKYVYAYSLDDEDIEDDVDVISIKVEQSEKVFEYKANSDGSVVYDSEKGYYCLRAVEEGDATVLVTYKKSIYDPTGPGEGTIEYAVNVRNSYSLEFIYPNDSHTLLQGGTMTVESKLCQLVYNYDEETGEDVKSYIPVNDYFLRPQSVNTNVSVNETDQTKIIVKAQEPGYISEWIEACIPGRTTSAALVSIDVQVSAEDCYYTIAPAPEDIGPVAWGGTLQVEPKLYKWTLDAQTNELKSEEDARVGTD